MNADSIARLDEDRHRNPNSVFKCGAFPSGLGAIRGKDKSDPRIDDFLKSDPDRLVIDKRDRDRHPRAEERPATSDQLRRQSDLLECLSVHEPALMRVLEQE